MPRKMTRGEQEREHIALVESLNAGYEAALADIQVYRTMPDFDLDTWIEARLAIVRTQA